MTNECPRFEIECAKMAPHSADFRSSALEVISGAQKRSLAVLEEISGPLKSNSVR
jgi:hypothetical protein